ncbi:MAG TPA: hypothetical protein VFW23_08115 [Tepidisphaeraceae bacterium]|nr:hypothetical protein [Tepidisphaeraceae bacterium]
MSPLGLLGLAIGLAVVAAIGQRASHRRLRKSLRALAADWNMNYAQSDSLGLTPRIAGNFPIPGAADLVINDLIYSTDRMNYRYIFTAQFTVGVVHRKRRLSRVATFTEPREGNDSDIDLSLAPEELDLIEQYRRLAPATPSQ